MSTGGGGPRVLVLGLAAQYPLAGVVWQALHYLLGLTALGCDVYYVEDGGAPPYDPVAGGIGSDVGGNVRALARALEPRGLGARWAYWDAARDEWHGRSRTAVGELYRSADAILNLCGATRPRSEHRQGAVLCYVETDPMYEQMRAAEGAADALEFLGAHDVLFSYGELLGTPACAVPAGRFRWIATRPPVVLDAWRPGTAGARWRSVATWENKGKDVVFRGETYRWTKHENFRRILPLPRRTGAALELAMDPLDAAVVREFRTHGWHLVDPRPLSADPDTYRAYIEGARGELTVAKDIYVRPRSGWFSDRSVCFLAAGKPVVTQETGFSDLIPSGCGLLGFATLDEAVAAVRAVEADYERHARAAREIAAEYFAAERVLHSMLSAIGLA